MKQKLVISFLDRVAPKNKLQIDIIHEAGFSSGFFVNEYNIAAEKFFNKGDFHQVLKQGFISRFFQIISFLFRYRKVIHHLEVYPGGRFAFIYVVLAKIFNLPVICVERGDLWYLISGGYDKMTRLSIRLCYLLSNIIWYREVYMKSLLKKMGYDGKLFFLHNAVDSETIHQTNNPTFLDRDIDFLWVNRLTPERKSEWFVNILAEDFFKDTHNVLAGFLSNTLYYAEQDYVKENCPCNLELQAFVEDPSILYKRARFFVLPAEFVFANNALLEAMSFGVVPLIVNKPGYELLVDDGVSGFVSLFIESEFKVIMKKAIELNADTFQQMSEASKNHVHVKFSKEVYKQKLIQLYHLIQN